MTAMPQPEADSRARHLRACEAIRDRGIRHGKTLARNAIIKALRDAKLLDALEVVMKLGDLQ